MELFHLKNLPLVQDHSSLFADELLFFYAPFPDLEIFYNPVFPANNFFFKYQTKNYENDCKQFQHCLEYHIFTPLFSFCCSNHFHKICKIKEFTEHPLLYASSFNLSKRFLGNLNVNLESSLLYIFLTPPFTTHYIMSPLWCQYCV